MAAERLWVVVPAAGRGTRMGADRPKQYLRLAGRPVLEHALHRACAHPAAAGAVVALAADDGGWGEVRPPEGVAVATVTGGAERCDSVRAALAALAGRARAEDLVAVHDAARPCLPRRDLEAVVAAAAADADGALLALPVGDTLKREAEGRVAETVPREGLWRALTPQVFRYGLLREALEGAAGAPVTDEAAAVERLGRRPRLVAGSPLNLKITHPGDLALAAAALRLLEEEGA
ncbi:2-C-methyl-D-erythritol 4-phosphate cytidylyltransferase [Inmirania thermothiophila]|uniref:2-C-methyl-D-erythritol 4-phosphate cytidylyltransferase n=1 Tax=Inmirania thermothiophila TaxID=1750597 RepID=A0A3N1Y091_9GAMM|nr:2-C-methyl-D-erythritol 4-phosphate cytidylyltransferase [Inmirania thermothiophila]ROR32236.1 2-C-methyl-D-erythritol 4-phosphate cytidylyltransferase [Inmirania thermothiophila]